VTGGDPYELVVTPPAARAIQTGLPEAVAAAAIEFLTGALIGDPRRAGKPLRSDLAGIHSARLGTYRVLYRINDTTREIIVLRIDHRTLRVTSVQPPVDASKRTWAVAPEPALPLRPAPPQYAGR